MAQAGAWMRMLDSNIRELEHELGMKEDEAVFLDHLVWMVERTQWAGEEKDKAGGGSLRIPWLDAAIRLEEAAAACRRLAAL